MSTRENSLNVSTAIYSGIWFLINLSCVGATITSYFYFKGSISTPLYIIIIPFYVGFFCYIFCSMYQLYHDVVFLKEKTKYTFSDLICSSYSLKIIYD